MKRKHHPGLAILVGCNREVDPSGGKAESGARLWLCDTFQDRVMMDKHVRRRGLNALGLGRAD